MRLLIATLSRNLWGGAEKYVQALIPELTQRGHSVGLLHEYRAKDGAPAIDSECAGLATWCSQELGIDAALRSIRAWSPDLVYSQGLDDVALERALLDSFPAILYAHTYWGTCVTGKKCHSLPRIEPCGRTLGPACLLLYYPRRCGGWNPQTMFQLYRIESARKARLPEYQAVLVASRHMQQEYARHGVSPERLSLVPLPIDESPAAAGLDPKPLRYRVLFIGRLMDVKGIDYLLAAVPRAEAKLGQRIHLTIAGDGPQRGHLEALAKRSGVDVEFAGWVDEERRSDLLRQADLLAVPSLWPEPFGMVGVEAGRFGVPAAGFAVGGIPDWLIGGETGELAPGDPPTAEGLADAMVRAMADAEHHRKLGRGARAFAARFGMAQHLAQLERILQARTAPAPLISTVA